jgi:hypothetical protein
MHLATSSKKTPSPDTKMFNTINSMGFHSGVLAGSHRRKILKLSQSQLPTFQIRIYTASADCSVIGNKHITWLQKAMTHSQDNICGETLRIVSIFIAMPYLTAETLLSI